MLYQQCSLLHFCLYFHHLYLKFSVAEIKVQDYTVLPAKSNSDVMFCLLSYQGLIIDKSLVY